MQPVTDFPDQPRFLINHPCKEAKWFHPKRKNDSPSVDPIVYRIGAQRNSETFAKVYLVTRFRSIEPSSTGGWK